MNETPYLIATSSTTIIPATTTNQPTVVSPVDGWMHIYSDILSLPSLCLVSVSTVDIMIFPFIQYNKDSERFYECLYTVYQPTKQDKDNAK